ncbi:MAG TPA: hypothetical protein VJ850_08765 [Candidatus Limnocylindrales bacterium]|nr:hypothetical protein [Candidatus Limnocylindrales bacterium]
MIVVGILTPNAAPAIGAVARRAATGGGARVEVVGVAPAGGDGDRLLLELVSAGVGHATVTRSGATTVEPADLELALRYLPDVRVIVLVAPEDQLLRVAAAGSSWSGAALVVIGPLDAAATMAAADAAAIVLEPPAHDPDEAFAGLVAAFARRVDAGEAPARAWPSTLASLAVDPA